MMPKIKICGIRNDSDVDIISKYLPEYAGFVFYEKSKRNLSYEEAERLLSMTDKRIKKAAVVVSPDVSVIRRLNDMDFDLIQIHGELHPDVIDAADKDIWRAVNLSEDSDMNRIIAEIEEKSDKKIKGIVCDGAGYGAGKTFNWRKSKRLLKAGVNSPPMFILAGGLDEKNVLEGIDIFSPDVVDVSSSVENENGKDEELVKRFIETVRGKDE